MVFFQGTQIEVVADPDDVKLGSGGSTLHTLQHLLQTIGPKLHSSKVLIIHSGEISPK